jgi:hypothetical protein
MSSSDTLALVRRHDPARRLAALAYEQREQLRLAIISTPFVEAPGAVRSRSRWGTSGRRTLVLIGAVLVLLAVVGGGIAAIRLLTTPAQEEQGLPDGSAMFVGTHPTCAQVSSVQFRCVLQSAPSVEYIVGNYLGAKMPSVDATKHIDGGCIATSADGLQWDCYLGQAAVAHNIIDGGLLGQYQPEPSHG